MCATGLTAIFSSRWEKVALPILDDLALESFELYM